MQSVRISRQWIFILAFAFLLLVNGLFATKTAISYEEDPGGNTIPASNEIIGFVYDDLDGDGQRTSGEPGISTLLGVTLLTLGPDSELGGGDDVVIQTTTTFANGFYVFTGVTQDTYGVQVDALPDYIDTSPNPDVVVVGENGAIQDFGKRRAGTISGVVFNDRNGNGVQNAGEPGISGVTITLNGTSTTTTAGDGTYAFTSVSAGSHVVEETDPPGFVSTTPNRVTVSLTAGGSGNASFGDQQQGTVSGTVFNDLNGNGVQDIGESGITGVTITLDGATTVTTNSDGVYSFAGVAAGVHTVVETDPAGFVSTTPNTVNVSVASGGSATANFGDQQQGTVSGRVFNDLDGDGTQTAGEPGISSVKITLKRAATGAAISTTNTTSTGSYTFLNVAPDSYSVEETDPAGFVSTTPNTVTVSVAAGGSATANFGDQQRGTISGRVFNDLNGNGVQDGGESGIAGVTITRDGVITTTTTGSGSYTFRNVTVGVHTVVETDPTGFVSTTPNRRTVSVPANGSATANFGDQQQGTVSGRVFNDLNGNGIQDTGESGIGGVTVTLDGGTTTTTAGNGSYSFVGVAAGSHTVVETDPTGFVSTTPNSRTVSVPANGSATANFGDQQQGTVSGRVFNDLNGNGVQDTSESGIGGVTMTLDGGATTTTTGNGSFSFTGVSAGVHTVVETDPSGFVSTTPNSRTVSVPANGAATANFGDQQQGTISGRVFNDLNGNGVQDAGEAGIGGAAISLDGTITTTTSGGGSYKFTGVATGLHSVVETDPAGFVSTTPNNRSVSVPANGAATANFGDQQQGTISGSVFNDVNGNGIHDADEPGIGGVTVTLDGATSATTSGNGSYSFAGVAAGSHTVVETDPTGFVSTTPNNRTVSVPANGSATASFGDQQQGTVSGRVFNDLNGNGLQDADEAGIGGVTLTLDGGTTTTTSGNGSYSFAGVSAGVHTVVESDPSGFVSTTPNNRTVSVPANGSASANFGDRQQGTVSGRVFNDLNGNGVQDAGESGIGGVTVRISGGGTPRTTTTAGNGSYIFTGETPGNRVVQETDPADFASTTPNNVVVTIPANGSASANFGDRQQGTISGVVFTDIDGDSIQDADEPGIGGVTVTLDGTATATTAGNGAYSFGSVGAGLHRVVETDPPGFVSTTPNTRTLSVPASGSASANFGDQQQGAIAGTVFNDLNGDGLRNGSEVGVDGVVITLDSTITTTTSGGGAYQFTAVTAGAHTVVESDPPGFVSTTPNTRTVSVPANGAASASFGDQQQGTVSGVLFLDYDGDNYPDDSEPRLAGVQVQLLQSPSQTLVDTTTTLADGSFTFTNVAPGNYLVQIVLPPGYSFPTGAAQAAGLVFVNQNERPVSLGEDDAAAVSVATLLSGSISGVVFNDQNGNGLLDVDEQAIGGAVITLRGSSGATLGTATSSGDGSYSFTGQPAGTYTVTQASITGFATAQSEKAVALATNDSAAVANFPNQPIGSITGKVFHDENANRVQDPGEQGIGGVIVTLDGSATAITSGNGSYSFLQVNAGTHTLVESDPTGFTSTTPNTQAVVVSANGAGTANFGDYFGTVPVVVYMPLAANNAELVRNETFESTVGSGWSAITTSLSPSQHRFLGEFSNGTVTLSLQNLPAHARVRVAFDLYIIRSWDGSWPSTQRIGDEDNPWNPYPGGTDGPDDTHYGPDRWKMEADGQTLLDTTFTNWPKGRQAYPENYPGGDFPGGTGAREVNSLGYAFGDYPQLDSVYRIEKTFSHTGSTLNLKFSAAGLQSISDESWGLDNVRVEVIK